MKLLAQFGLRMNIFLLIRGLQFLPSIDGRSSIGKQLGDDCNGFGSEIGHDFGTRFLVCFVSPVDNCCRRVGIWFQVVIAVKHRNNREVALSKCSTPESPDSPPISGYVEDFGSCCGYLPSPR